MDILIVFGEKRNNAQVIEETMIEKVLTSFHVFSGNSISENGECCSLCFSSGGVI